MKSSKGTEKGVGTKDSSSRPIQPTTSEIPQKELTLTKPYSFGAYNRVFEKEQRIRITEGCPNQCPYCGEPKELKTFEIPEIKRRFVRILDMNLLSHKEADMIIYGLGLKRIGKNTIQYELTCGIDYRFLTPTIAERLKRSRFVNIRIAWDWGLDQQYRIKDAIEMLVKAGYPSKSIMVFMICNWRIPYEDNLSKMELCKVWRVKIADCWFDNQVSPGIIPIYWTKEQIEDFRLRVRKHNQMVTFGIDPELKKSDLLRAKVEVNNLMRSLR